MTYRGNENALSPRWPRVLVLTLGLLALNSLARAADWTQYRGPNHDAVAADTNVAKNFPAKGPKILWKAPVGEGFGTFAVAGDKAFLFVNRQNRETLMAMDASSGKELWATPVDQTITDRQGGSNPRSTPAIDGEHVYVFSVNLKLVCLKVADGSQVWEHNVKDEMGGKDLKWGNAASPVLDGDRIFVGGGGSGKSMAAFDKTSGKVLWATGDEKITHASPVPATIHGVRQIIFFMQSGLVSLAVEDGKELWRSKFTFTTSTASTPVVGTGKDADVVYCSAGYGVGSGAYKISKKGDQFAATQLWFIAADKKSELTNHWSTPLYHDGYIYGIFGFKDFAKGSDPNSGGPVKCLEMATGKVKWSKPGFGSGGGTIFVDKHLLVQGDAGTLALIEASPLAYKEKGRVKLPGEKFWCASIVANGKIYARSKTEAFCLDVSGKGNNGP